jgi:enamine deaminase RidA (YjgF/YER057c/UK114 family)
MCQDCPATGESFVSSGGIERDDPYGGAYGAALGVRAGDFVFTTVAGVVGLEEGEPVFAPTFEAQLETVGDHLLRRLRHFDAELRDIVDATVWVHPAVDIEPGALLDALQQRVFHDVMPAMSFVRSRVLYPDALIGVKVVAFSPRDES